MDMADDADIRRLWAEGKSGREIGEYLGRPRGSILRRVRELGLRRRSHGVHPGGSVRWAS